MADGQWTLTASLKGAVSEALRAQVNTSASGNQEVARRLEYAVFGESGSKTVAETEKGTMADAIIPWYSW
jgi:hypothetical protein